MFYLRLFATLVMCAMVGCASQGVGTGKPGDPPSVLVDGIRVPYTAVGSGPSAVVFIHGWSCDRSVWNSQVADPALSSGRRLIALDLPGHGQSDKPKAAYTMDLFVRSIAAVMDKEGIERAVLVGHSNGTPMARQFLRVHPERTAGLVVVDGALRSYFRNPSEWEQFLAPLRGPKHRQGAERMIDGMVKPMAKEEDRERLRKSMLATPQWVMVSAMQAVADPAVWAEDPITVPTLVVLAKSPFWTDGYEAWVRRLAPRCEYRVMDGVSHFLMIDRPAEFNGILSMWLDSNGF